MKAESLAAPRKQFDDETPIRVKKLGHVVFRVKDLDATIKFWTEVMGFQLSDRNENGLVFLRYGSDHHNIGVAKAQGGELPNKGQAGFDHLALEVGSVAELFKIRDFLHARQVPIVFQGRRGAGCNVGIEFKDPNGFMIEIYAAMDQIGWDGKSRPSEQWRRAATLEDAVANPVVGAKY
jgi:catechol 2,3-dioxygenase